MSEQKSKAKQRFCWFCGADMGLIEDRHYERGDTCGRSECDRAVREEALADREEAHEQLDRDMGFWG